MKTLSAAIIGAGNIAGGYDEKKQDGDSGIYTHAGAFAVHGGFELTTVFDTDTARSESFCRTWQAGCAAASLDEIYGAYHDVVSICSPNETHFDIVRDLLSAACCRTIFVEKPLAPSLAQIEQIMHLAEKKNIHVVVNFQRRNEPEHRQVRKLIASRPEAVLSAACCYMKGLQHIGVTAVDTITFLCGFPEAVLSYNRIYNQEAAEFSYEFVLYYPGFTVAVKTTDAERYVYNFHVFEVDLFFTDKRMTFLDNSQRLRETPVTSYAYSGVKVLNERAAQYRETGYKTSMLDAVEYLYGITAGTAAHETNTPQDSFNDAVIINRIIESFELGSVKLEFEPGLWKK